MTFTKLKQWKINFQVENFAFVDKHKFQSHCPKSLIFLKPFAQYIVLFTLMTLSLYTIGLVPESKSKMEKKRALWSDPASQEPLCCHLWYICSSKDWQLPSGMLKTKQYFGSTFGSHPKNSGFVYFSKMKYKLSDL